VSFTEHPKPQWAQLAPRWVHTLGGCGVGLIIVATVIWVVDSDDGGTMAWGFMAVGTMEVIIWITWVVIGWSRRSHR
jgi:hypothetical protein